MINMILPSPPLSSPVERYTGTGKEERRGTVSVHSLQKKVRRFQQTLTQLTGLRSKVSSFSGVCVCVCVCVCDDVRGAPCVQTVDPKFEELEQKMMSLETFLRQLLRNITTWQEDLQVYTYIHRVEPLKKDPLYK